VTDIVTDQTFKNQTVKIDGKEFINCHFDGCTFHYEGREANAINCTILKCRWGLGTDALRFVNTVQKFDWDVSKSLL